jgi:hypothetical protein
MTAENYITRLARQIKEAVPKDALPDGDTDSLFAIYAVLALTKGKQVERRDVHNAWAAWMATTDPKHESIKPYDDLPSDVREEDDPYVVAIQRVARRID